MFGYVKVAEDDLKVKEYKRKKSIEHMTGR